MSRVRTPAESGERVAGRPARRAGPAAPSLFRLVWVVMGQCVARFLPLASSLVDTFRMGWQYILEIFSI
jgi:hypothetical protein